MTRFLLFLVAWFGVSVILGLVYGFYRWTVNEATELRELRLDLDRARRELAHWQARRDTAHAAMRAMRAQAWKNLEDQR